jgi:hypothetical protein
MKRFDEIRVAEGTEPGSLRRLSLAGFAEEPVFASSESVAGFIGRFADAGVTDFVFGLANRAQPAFADGVTSGQFATREKLERFAADVLAAYRN